MLGGVKKKEENKKPLWLQNPAPGANIGAGPGLGSGIETFAVPSRVGNTLADRRASNSPPNANKKTINNIGLPMTGMKEEELESENSIKDGSYGKKATSGNEWG